MSEEAIDDKAAKPTRAELLEEEGEIAADYLEELMDIADIDGDIDIDVADGRAQLSIVCEDEDDSNLRTLVGRDGKTLGALQELVRLAVQTSTGQRSWLMLDIDGYRSSRRDELIRKAEDAITEVKESGEEFAFKAMNSFERKIIHDQVAKAGLVSESEGEGDGRHVVVRPADD
ncbi:single-stranded DNA-binding protein [Brevibacterium casei]|uniref:Single-stranded DNA-binding protein n=1 Tax=Brevibacterium casei TaxID=33889 RepID=A0A162ZIZ2_9MICO|nr:R3H domain-containing nucleic acid-binding protein [Brevibacterium casei]SIH74470.1 spoIIIJ-associated protein [Mycobacteroides abscessus subsp. abscessus]KZE17688.1 single-stranded DNA-binding protein [Brevibacterium casei]MBE4696227.1 single-stranded DNA-binding protein [Brevibacterium casei]MBY3579349.1 single-stranded DNA-binding protein [Brevibacterium casei]MCT1446236.1 single-stranded DNA-binding protein [Brevibacterium casei]